MKKFFTPFLIFLTFSLSAQDYKLFNAGSVKYFQSSQSMDSAVGLSFDMATSMGTDSVFFPYTKIGNEIPTDSCEFWGAETCFAQDRPIWIGSHIITDNSDEYLFMTNAGDSLYFRFDLVAGDSTRFYSDPEQNFYLLYEGSDTSTVLTLSDSVKNYRIIHTDESGNPINSAISDKLVRVGKTFGLIDFIRIDFFPEVLEHFTLVGNNSPKAGWYEITAEDIYDFQPGDIIQYSDYYNMNPGPPYGNYLKYIRHNILDRTDTEDSIIYRVARLRFNIDSTTGTYDTIFRRYKRNEVFKTSPYDYIEPNEYMLYNESFVRKSYAGLTMWTHTRTNEGIGYCPEDHCWGLRDYNGPPPEGTVIYVCGLGLFKDSWYLWGWGGGSTIVDDLRINYFKKGSVEWGEEIIVGLPESKVMNDDYRIYPNPVVNELKIESATFSDETIIIFNISGQMVKKVEVIAAGAEYVLDIASLADGVFLIKILSDKSVFTRKFVKSSLVN